jgi:eukaryotic-like serine/threonine-protein kinase
MPFIVPIDDARLNFPEYTFISSLTPSEQKSAFHVKDSNGNDLCLKIISPNYDLDRLQREIIALQSISHKNIVKLIEYTFSSKPSVSRHYIVEQFIEGNDLQELIKDGKPWPVQKAAPLFFDLFNGLAEFRRINLVHRDLKPTNIRIRNDGTPVIIDFGIARLLSMDDITKTSDGAALGTPEYFSPEQFQGTKRDIDHRTDLYTMGTIMYRVFVGHHPFHLKMSSYLELKNAVCTSNDYLNDPTFLALPRVWNAIISRLLEKEKARRPQDAMQVARIIRSKSGDIK